MAKHLKWLMGMLIPLFSLILTSCSDNDGPSMPSNVPTEIQQVYIACFSSNSGNLPSYATTLYEDNEYRYLIAARNPKYELILLPYFKQDGEWVAAYEYESNNPIGRQLTPIKCDNNWLCSIEKYPRYLSEASLEAMTEKMSFNAESSLSIAPFTVRGCYYGYLTIEGGKKVNIKIFCSLLKMDRKQGSSTFGYIQSAGLDYQFY